MQRLLAATSAVLMSALLTGGCLGVNDGGSLANSAPDSSLDLSCNMVPDDITRPGTVWIYDGKKRYLANVLASGIAPVEQNLANVTLNRAQNIKLGNFVSSFTDAGQLQSSGSGAAYTVYVHREFTNPQRLNVPFDQRDLLKSAIQTWLSAHTLPPNSKVIWISDTVSADATTYKVSKSGGFGLEVQQAVKALKWDNIAVGFDGGNQLTIGPQDFKATKGKSYTVCIQANSIEKSVGSAAGGAALLSRPLDKEAATNFGVAPTDLVTFK